MKYSLLSSYLDHFRESCTDQFSRISNKRKMDIQSILQTLNNSTAPLEKVNNIHTIIINIILILYLNRV